MAAKLFIIIHQPGSSEEDSTSDDSEEEEEEEQEEEEEEEEFENATVRPLALCGGADVATESNGSSRRVGGRGRGRGGGKARKTRLTIGSAASMTSVNTEGSPG